jgi:TPR repeat protein/AcrR family transcriptional regulator
MARMGTIVANDETTPNRSWEQATTREAILAAARKVAQRDGVLAMSLTGVAKEAGFAPTSVYAYFTSKDDLLLAVIADDLTTLARAMRDTTSRPVGEITTKSLQLALPGATAQTMAHPESKPPLLEDQSGRMPITDTRREQLRYVTSDAPAGAGEAIARLQETIARLETRPVDAWLERRLREFERALASLEAARNDHHTSRESIDDRFGALRQSLEQVETRLLAAGQESASECQQRLDASGKRLLEIISAVQSDVSQLAKRVSAFENTAFVPKQELVGEPNTLPLPQDVPPAELPPPLIVTAPDVTIDASDTRAPSYIAAARRSAQAAATAREEPMRHEPKRPSRMLFHAAAASLVLFVALLAGAGLLLRNEAMEVAPSHGPAKAAQPRATHRSTSASIPRGLQSNLQSRLRTLAESGKPNAELLIGLEYLDGEGVAKSDTSAYQWLARAAAKGQPLAQYNLGALWESGRGVHADAVQAFQWYGSSALRGNRRAMHNLAIAYAEGLGTTKNLPEAAHWFERAAMLGAVNSQFNLAVLYERGMGVKQSLADAYRWYAIAASHGDRESQARIAALASSLPSGDLDTARNAAAVFKPDPIDGAANFAPKPETLQ